MNITKTTNNGVTELKIGGWLDTQASPEVTAAVNEIGSETESLIIDLSDLEYIASSGVRAIITAYKKVQGNLVVKNTRPGIMSIFTATGIDKKIKFE